MAVTATATRIHESYSQRELVQFIVYALSGTYVTGGFVTPYSGITGSSLGSNPTISKLPLAFDWYSPTGHLYYTTIVIAGTVVTCTTKIFTAPGTELGNGVAVPNASVLCAITEGRY